MLTPNYSTPFALKAAIAGAILALSTFPARAGLSVTTSTDAAALVSSLVGSGITVVSGSESYVGISYEGEPTTENSGFFSGGATIGGPGGLGFDSGILLTTGDANGAVGPNDQTGYSGTYPFSTSLSFDFTSAGGDLYLNYVFASEDYNDYLDSFLNDTFQILLDGVNIALAPNTTSDVNVNTINLDNNAAYFRNNDVDAPSFDLQYDGFTTVLSAIATGLGAGVHRLEILISDSFDSGYDSAVFLQSNSLSVVQNSVPDAGATAALLAFGLMGVAALRRRVR